MSWVRLDDAFLDNRKFLRAGPLAGYLHIAAIAWANRNLTDGVIPREQPPRLASWHVVNHDLDPEVVGNIGHEDAVKWASLVHRLLECGLWVERDDGDYEIHDYLDYQKSAQQIREEREKSAQRQERWRNKKNNGDNTVTNGARKDATHASRNAVTNASVTDAPNPNPKLRTPPDPPASGGRQRDRIRFEGELAEFCAEHFPGVPSGLIAQQADLLRRSDQEPTVEALRPLVERWQPTTEAPAA